MDRCRPPLGLRSAVPKISPVPSWASVPSWPVCVYVCMCACVRERDLDHQNHSANIAGRNRDLQTPRPGSGTRFFLQSREAFPGLERQVRRPKHPALPRGRRETTAHRNVDQAHHFAQLSNPLVQKSMLQPDRDQKRPQPLRPKASSPRPGALVSTESHPDINAFASSVPPARHRRSFGQCLSAQASYSSTTGQQQQTATDVLHDHEPRPTIESRNTNTTVTKSRHEADTVCFNFPRPYPA